MILLCYLYHKGKFEYNAFQMKLNSREQQKKSRNNVLKILIISIKPEKISTEKCGNSCL